MNFPSAPCVECYGCRKVATTRGKQGPQERKLNDQQLLVEIREVHQHSKGRYGAPRVHAALCAKGMHASKRRVARLMRVAGLRGKSRRKYKTTTNSNHALPVAQNLVNREFKVAEPNTVWGADLTYIPTREGWLYLSVVLDLHSRMVVGWAMGHRMTTDLPLAALVMAAQRRSPSRGLIHHSDRGSQFASHAYQRQLWSLGMLCSMSNKGDCWDNAVVESFFATLKRELMDGRVFNTRQEAEQEIFAFIEIFDNRQRLHSSLGYLSPAEFEARQLAMGRHVAQPRLRITGATPGEDSPRTGNLPIGARFAGLAEGSAKVRSAAPDLLD